MRRTTSHLGATLALIIGLTYPQLSRSDEYTSAKFLTRTPEQQAAYIDIAVQMVGFVASQNDPTQARCINDWYFAGEGTRDKKVKQIVETMRKNPQYHPGVIVMGVLQGACGSLKYTKP